MTLLISTDEEVRQMLGIDDPQIWIAYLLCIGSALGCIIYGLIHWNHEDPEEDS